LFFSSINGGKTFEKQILGKGALEYISHSIDEKSFYMEVDEIYCPLLVRNPTLKEQSKTRNKALTMDNNGITSYKLRAVHQSFDENDKVLTNANGLWYFEKGFEIEFIF